MGGESSGGGGGTPAPGPPGASIDPDVAEEENMMAGMTSEESDASISGAMNDPSYDNYAGSTALADQQSGSITGSNITDALIPGVGTLSVISSLNAGYLQQSLQQGGRPVYGSTGEVEGVVNETQAFGTTFSTYSGNPDLDPIGGPPTGGDDSTPTIISNQVATAVSAPTTPVRTASYNPDEVVDAYGRQSKKGRGSGRRSTIMTSAQGDTSQLTTILRPGLKGTLG